MQMYHLHTRDGRFIPDEEGVVLADDHAARLQAVKLLGELLTDDPEELLKTGSCAIIVRDDADQTLFHVEGGLIDAPATAKSR